MIIREEYLKKLFTYMDAPIIKFLPEYAVAENPQF